MLIRRRRYPPYDLGAFLPAGGLYASAADMGRFLQAQFASLVGYLTPAQIAEMWTDTIAVCGRALWRRSWRGRDLSPELAHYDAGPADRR
ncbi:MAG: hypothetical protein H6651_00865 [Ardenticatenales bacterium]|nr:hypothetical protein [Ardenticatenales bacterium]